MANILRRLVWSIDSRLNAHLQRKAETESKYRNLATARARGNPHWEAAIDAYSNTKFDERYLSPFGESRTTYQRAFLNLIFDENEREILYGCFCAAGKGGYLTDILDVVANDRVREYLLNLGMTNEELDTVIWQPRSKTSMFYALFGRDYQGFRIVNKIEEAMTQGGNFAAASVLYENPGFQSYDQSNSDDFLKLVHIWIKRFQSGEAGKTLANLRKETFYGMCPWGDETILRCLIRHGFFEPIHLVHLKRMRASTLQYLIEHLDDIREAGEHGEAFIEALRRQRLIK